MSVASRTKFVHKRFMEDDERLVQFKLLLPLYVKEWVADAAAKNRRSLSQEIVARLVDSFAEVPSNEKDLHELVSRIIRILGEQPLEKSVRSQQPTGNE